MQKNKSLLFFSIATLFAFFSPYPLLAYSPYLAFTFLTNPLLKALWMSFFCGLITDSLQSFMPFGFSSFAYSLCILVLYKLKWALFEDKMLSLPLFSTIFSLLFSFFQITALVFLKSSLHFTLSSFLLDLVIMPLCDGAYAFLFFTCLDLLLSFLKKKQFLLLFIKKMP